jgi:hypothetical protein
MIFDYDTSCHPCSDAISPLCRVYILNLVFYSFFFPSAAQKFPGQLQHRSDHHILTAVTLIGYLDLRFIVADPKRDFRACSYLWCGAYKTDR